MQKKTLSLLFIAIVLAPSFEASLDVDVPFLSKLKFELRGIQSKSSQCLIFAKRVNVKVKGGEIGARELLIQVRDMLQEMKTLAKPSLIEYLMECIDLVGDNKINGNAEEQVISTDQELNEENKDGASRELDELKTEYQNRIQVENEKLEQSLAELEILKRKYGEVESENKLLNEKLDAANSNFKQALKEKEDLKNDLEELDKLRNEHHASQLDAQAKIEGFEKSQSELETLNRKYKEIESDNKLLKELLTTTNSNYKQVLQEKEELKSALKEFDKLKTEYQATQNDARFENRKLEKLLTELEASKKRYGEVERENKLLNEKLATTNLNYKQSLKENGELKRASRELESLKTKYQEVQINARFEKEKLSKLFQELESLKKEHEKTKLENKTLKEKISKDKNVEVTEWKPKVQGSNDLVPRPKFFGLKEPEAAPKKIFFSFN